VGKIESGKGDLGMFAWDVAEFEARWEVGIFEGWGDVVL